MSALLKPGTVMIIGYVCSSILLILSVQGSKRRSCIDKDPREVGFTRDACVELGRNLHIKLHLTEETKPCAKLAAIRTSTCWPCRGCRKWQREDKQNAIANADVMAKSLAMVQHFIIVVAQEHKLIDMSDQTFIFGCIDATIDLLKESGLTLYSQEDTEKKKLIDEIEKLKRAFCGGYLKQLASEAEKRQADYLAELHKKEENDAGENLSREIVIAGLSTLEEDEEIKQTNRNGDRTETHKAGTNENEWEIGTKIEQDTNLTGFPDGPINQGEALGGEENQNMEEVPLHKSVFRNEYSRMCALLESGYDVKKKDKHDFIKELVKYGAPIRSRNLMGFKPVEEAVSYGDIETIKFLLLNFPKQVQEELIGKRRILLEEMDTIPNFYMELKWEFRLAGMIIPFVLPSDICKIRKRDRSVRMDWSLIGGNGPFSLKYGKAAMLFDGAASPSPLVYFMDLKKKKFVKTELEDTSEISDEDLGKKAKEIMMIDIASFTVSTRNAAYTKVMHWWYTDTIKTETVSSFTAQIYTVSGLIAIFSKRNEHLREAEIERKKIESESDPTKSVPQKAERIENGENKEQNDNKDKGDQEEEKKPEKVKFVPIPPPPPTDVTWEEYINAPPGQYRPLARKMFRTRIATPIKESTLAVVPDFPITKEAFIRIIEVVAPFKQFNKLREFMDTKLPPGFPVKLEVPIMLGLSARITLLKFETSETISEKPILDENLFKLPEDFTLMKEEEMDAKMKSLFQ